MTATAIVPDPPPLASALSPAGAVETLLKAGVRISERELRAKARRQGRGASLASHRR